MFFGVSKILISSNNIRTLIENFVPVISTNIMDSSTLQEIKQLFKRLKEANKQAEILRREITNIKEEIHVISESEIFKQHLNTFSVHDVFDDNSDGPPLKKSKTDFTEKDGYVVVYTDGACENNGTPIAKAGIGVWFGESHPLNVSQPVKGKATNNAGEIQACIAAIRIAKEQGIKKLKIVSDSQFTINSMTKWIQNWKKNNWKLAGNKGDVKNKTDFKELDSLCQEVNVKWEYVAAHKGTRGNEEADRLAKEGAKLYKSQ